MPLTFIFVNKPKTFLVYVIGLVLILLTYFFLYGAGSTGVSFIPLWIAYTIQYSIGLFWYLFVKDSESLPKIKNVSLSCLKRSFRIFFNISIFVDLSLVLLSFFYFLILNNSVRFEGVVFGLTIILMVYSFVSFAVFKNIILSKFISEGLKSNTDLSNTTLDTFYKDIREVFMKRVLK